MPRRPPINPQGWYHVGSRGCYGRTLFTTALEHELFLRMYARAARRYRWRTVAWALMKNHHHFVVQLTEGGLSEGLRELHGGYSRWIHERCGQTRKGHLFRHAFFARELEDDDGVCSTCAYVDANPLVHRKAPTARAGDWGGYRATLGRGYPRPFHSPAALLERVDPDPRTAQRKYREAVIFEHARIREGRSPNDVTERG